MTARQKPGEVAHVTGHAIERCIERVDPGMTWDEARRFLSSPVIQRAAAFGARYVRLGTGQRVVLEGAVIVTVKPKPFGGRPIKAELRKPETGGIR
jgi:hypothetical protein